LRSRIEIGDENTNVDAKAAIHGLSKDEILRYSRHLIMQEVGMDGPLKLKNSKVMLIGKGGLGGRSGSILLLREFGQARTRRF